MYNQTRYNESLDNILYLLLLTLNKHRRKRRNFNLKQTQNPSDVAKCTNHSNFCTILRFTM